MLGTGAKSTDEKCQHQCENAATQAGENIAESGKRGPERENDGRAKPFSQKARRNLKPGQRAGKYGLHQAKRGKSEAKFGLPDRQHHIDQVCIAVMQRMGATGHAKCATFFLLGAGGRYSGGHGFIGRRSTKVVLTNVITDSPRWLTPVDRILSSPRPGRLCDTRASTTSLA